MQINSTSSMPLIYHIGPWKTFPVQSQQKKQQNYMRNMFTVIKTPERRQWFCSGVFIVNFEYISKLVLKFLMMILNR